MKKIARSDLLTLEAYSEQRPEWRKRVMEHKKTRVVALGSHARLYFEDRLTMQYQIQEMLRAEKIFDSRGIREELEVYNDLIPDGNNLKATFMLEYEDPELRRQELARLVGIEDTLWAQAGFEDRLYAIANEDLERSTEDKTASVHFVRFEFTPQQIRELQNGAALGFGVAHENYPVTVEAVPDAIRQSLVSDFD